MSRCAVDVRLSCKVIHIFELCIFVVTQFCIGSHFCSTSLCRRRSGSANEQGSDSVVNAQC